MLDYSLTKLFTLSYKNPLTDFERKIIGRLQREEKAKKSIWYRIYLYIGDLFNWKGKEGKIDRVKIYKFQGEYGFSLFYHVSIRGHRGNMVCLYKDIVSDTFYDPLTNLPQHESDEKEYIISVSVDLFCNQLRGLLTNNLYWTVQFDKTICDLTDEVINYLKSKNNGELWKEVYNFQIKLR